jgi:hypothetical protein
MQILNIAYNKLGIEQKVHALIDKFAERELRSLVVVYQVGELRTILSGTIIRDTPKTLKLGW